jgi:hypothetical protein
VSKVESLAPLEITFDLGSTIKWSCVLFFSH